MALYCRKKHYFESLVLLSQTSFIIFVIIMFSRFSAYFRWCKQEAQSFSQIPSDDRIRAPDTPTHLLKHSKLPTSEHRRETGTTLDSGNWVVLSQLHIGALASLTTKHIDLILDVCSACCTCTNMIFKPQMLTVFSIYQHRWNSYAKC